VERDREKVNESLDDWWDADDGMVALMDGWMEGGGMDGWMDLFDRYMDG
jgi:hypothetical protein